MQVKQRKLQEYFVYFKVSAVKNCGKRTVLCRKRILRSGQTNKKERRLRLSHTSYYRTLRL